MKNKIKYGVWDIGHAPYFLRKLPVDILEYEAISFANALIVIGCRAVVY